MYSEKFWDDIYLSHYEDAPWMEDRWKSESFAILKQDIHQYARKSNKPLRLLDYGCGNGRIGFYFYREGMKVDLCDISQVLINRLKEVYKNNKGLGIIKTNTPMGLGAKCKYDIVIAWNVLHHINPNNWHLFIRGFFMKMKNDGILLISGWDEDDEVIKQDRNRARYTNQITWCINTFLDYLGDLPLEILENHQIREYVPLFGTNRVFRYYALKKPSK